MEITRNEQGYDVIKIDFNTITFNDYLLLCNRVKKGEFLQDPTAPFVFSSDDIEFMCSIASKKDLYVNSTCEKYFEILRRAILNKTTHLPFTNKFETRIAHKIVWFFQKKLVNDSKNSVGITFTSQDLANFDYDLLKLSEHYKKNSSLKVERNSYISQNKQRYLKNHPSSHYCDIIQESRGLCLFKLMAPMPINYELI